MPPLSPKSASSQLPTAPATLRSELLRPYIYLPLLLSLLLLALSLWDQSRYTLSLLSPVLFLWSTVLLPLPAWAHLLWLAARGGWGWWDGYRELVRVTMYEAVAFLLLWPVLEDVRQAVRAVVPLLPRRAERKGLELRIVWGWALAQVARAAAWALGKVAGVSRVSGDAYRKALAGEGAAADRSGFLAARLDSIIRATTSLSLTSSTSASVPSPEDGAPAHSPSKRKPGRPRRMTANPYSLAPPPLHIPPSHPAHPAQPAQAHQSPPSLKVAAAAAAAARKYRLPASPPSSDRELPASGSASAVEQHGHGYGHGHGYPEGAEPGGGGAKTTPERRYPRRTKMSVDMGRTPEPVLRELREVKLEEEGVSPVKRGRGRPRKNA
ncbi:hypothetical protein CALCODRAFT_506148 [Calocera cornea HHB12733]|uniref:Uncharacterized protein n=1 Tax=Calocera cornea HHB12733 TaxID=1353952 RepID=A0A165JAB1_9BASI|nr:hypothetical protein CALCODRAFT_506148 [Calocera cornea HHB12733]